MAAGAGNSYYGNILTNITGPLLIAARFQLNGAGQPTIGTTNPQVTATHVAGSGEVVIAVNQLFTQDSFIQANYRPGANEDGSLPYLVGTTFGPTGNNPLTATFRLGVATAVNTIALASAGNPTGFLFFALFGATGAVRNYT